MLVIKRKRKNLRGKKSVILFYPAIIANPTGPAKRSAYSATPNTVSTRVPSHTLNRCPPRYDPHHDCEAASGPNPPPMLHKPQLNTVDPLIDLVVAYAKAIHAPNIAFGCATTVIFFQRFYFLFVFRRISASSRRQVLASCRTAGVGRLRRRRAEPAGGLMARKPSPEGRASILRGRRLEAERRGGLPPRPADPAEGASRGGRSRLRRRAGRGPPRGASCERELRGGQGGGAEACPQTCTATAASQASAHAAQTRSHPG